MTDHRGFFDHLRKLLSSGAITYEQAKAQAATKIEEMNAIGREIAKKHGKKFKPFTFTGLMR